MRNMQTIKISGTHREEILDLARALKDGGWLSGMSRFLDYPNETDLGERALRDSVRYYADTVYLVDRVIELLSMEDSRPD